MAAPWPPTTPSWWRRTVPGGGVGGAAEADTGAAGADGARVAVAAAVGHRRGADRLQRRGEPPGAVLAFLPRDGAKTGETPLNRRPSDLVAAHLAGRAIGQHRGVGQHDLAPGPGEAQVGEALPGAVHVADVAGRDLDGTARGHPGAGDGVGVGDDPADPLGGGERHRGRTGPRLAV